MELKDIFGVLTPTLLLIFTATFVLIWRSNKEQFHSRDLAIAFLLNAIGFAGTWLLQDIAPRAAFLGCGFLAQLSIVFFARGVLSRLNIDVPYKLFAALQMVSMIFATTALFGFGSLSMVLIIISTISGIQAGVIAYKMQKTASKNIINLMTVSVLGVVAVLMPLSLLGAFFSNSASLNIETYQSSIEWITLHILAIILSTIGALCFILFSLNQAMVALQKQADTDELTGLSRRSRFEKDAMRVFAQEKRTPLPVSLIVMDIDKFKKINDKYGHLAGDKVLSRVGQLLQTTSRSTDIVGRIGGEEFAILLWNADIKGARLVAEQLRGTLENYDFGALLGGQSCTASFGVAQLEEGESYKDLFALADRALYRAKNTGRNRVSAATFVLEEAA